MASTSGYSMRSSSVKRLLQEAKELATETTNDGIHAAPFEENLYHWHFTIEGPKDSEFDGGLYHGRITLPPQYPFKAPDIMLLTPNGRFELNKKVCLTITGFHEESWQPAWGIRTALVGLSSFFTTEAKGAIGGLDAPASERKRLAALSRDWTCPGCQLKNCEILPPRSEAKKVDTAVGVQISSIIESTGVTEGSSEVEPKVDTASIVEATTPPSEGPLQPADASIISSEKASVSTVDKTTPQASTLASASQIQPSTSLAAAMLPPPDASSVTSRPNRSDSMSRQQVEERHLQVVELLTRQLALTDPSLSIHHHAPSTGQSVAFAAPAGASNSRGNAGAAAGQASAPPMWLDGAIGAVLVALVSLVLRKVM